MIVLVHAVSHLLDVYIVPKLLHNNKCSLEIRRRDVMKRTPSSSSIRQSTILRQIQNYDVLLIFVILLIELKRN